MDKKIFLLKQLSCIIKSMKYIDNNKEEFEDSDVNQISNLLLSIPQFRDSLDIDDIEMIINKYNIIVKNIWNKYLSDPNLTSDGNFLVHRMRNFIEGPFHSPNISCSLVTPEHYSIFASKKELTPEDISIGLIIKPNNIIIAQDHDTGTFNDNDQDPDDMIVAAHNYVILTPQQIMCNVKKQSLKRNGELFNYKNHEFYSEIVCDDFEVIGVFSRISCNYDKLSDNAKEKYLLTEKYAKNLGLPFLTFNLEESRKKVNGKCK